MDLLDILKSKLKKYFSTEGMNTEEIFYIAGSQTLPPPLPPEEENEMLKRLENDDFEARQVLVEHNLRLVVYIAKKF